MTAITPKVLAERLETDAKTVRKFLRSDASGVAADAPGKGGRWSIDSGQVRTMRKAFAKWNADRLAAIADAKAKAAEDARNASNATENDEDEVELTED
jgi:hypothetical protein